MTSNAVVWFEIPTTGLERATHFYQAVLGLELSLQELGPLRMAWFPMHQGASGSTGCLIQAESYVPSEQGTLVYIHVDDIEACLARVEQHGGAVLNPKMAIGEYGFVGHFRDSEGNRVALHADS